MQPSTPFDPAFETQFAAPVCGVDEVGRGPWAGPVVAAAIILDPARIPAGLNDSKKLNVKKREALFEELIPHHSWAVGEASVAEIDAINILAASMLAMRRAVAALKVTPRMALIDGNRIPDDFPCPANAIVKGDGQVLSIAAASIIAKVHRDRLMAELAEIHPQYHWQNNAGYGTRAHQEALLHYGVTQHHRRSFRPIHNILYQEN